MNKAYGAARERRPTRQIGKVARNAAEVLTSATSAIRDSRAGAVVCPVWSEGKLVGAIAVSGSRQEENIELADWGAALISR
jgi:uncharacterized protein GlcG (DUF336 family)